MRWRLIERGVNMHKPDVSDLTPLRYVPMTKFETQARCMSYWLLKPTGKEICGTQDGAEVTTVASGRCPQGLRTFEECHNPRLNQLLGTWESVLMRDNSRRPSHGFLKKPTAPLSRQKVSECSEGLPVIR